MSSGQRQGFVGKMVFDLSFEEWAGCGYLGMENGTPGRRNRTNKAKERRQEHRRGALGLSSMWAGRGGDVEESWNRAETLNFIHCLLCTRHE